MIYSFWLFDRHSECVFRREWNQPSGDSRRRKEVNDDTAKLVFGICLSLRNISRKLTDEDAFQTFSTSQYKLHYFESASNLKMVFITDLGTPSLVNELQEIYSTLYLNYVVKNPLSPIEHTGGAGVDNELFSITLNAYIQGLQSFN